MQRKKGFTLMEMLIVVAIIGILVVVAIPVFSAQLEKTRAATCMANRRSLQSVLTAAYMSDDATLKLGADNSTIDVSAYTANYPCPSRGTITAKLNENGVAVVSCSIHTGSLGSGDTMAKVKTDIDAVIGNYSQLDSGAGEIDGSVSSALLKKLAADSIDLQALGAEAWKYDKGKQVLYWSTLDISNMQSGQNALTFYQAQYQNLDAYK